jgi:hypothetical protein
MKAKKKKEKVVEEKVEQVLDNGISPAETRKWQIVNGAWQNVDEVASALWGSIHSSLLDCSGPFFAYKSTKSNTELVQLVVVMNFDRNSGLVIPNDFGVGMITSGFSMLLPHVPMRYLETSLHDDLVKYRVETNIIEIYEQLILEYKKIYGEKES